ncbi:MAG: potassium channel family protein [Promethearchaeota archaeon]
MQLFLRSFLVALGQLRKVFIYLIVSIAIGSVIFLFYYPQGGSYTPSNILDCVLATFGLLLAMEMYEFPHEGDLIIKLMYITYPFLGLILIGLGIIEFGMFTFTYRYRIKAWNEWLATEMSGHTVLVGAAGNVGTRVLQELVRQEITVCVITKESERHREDIEQMLEIPDVAVVFGDAARSKVLHMANITKARACIIVTNDEMLNFRISVKVKKLNPGIKTVIRVFDKVFGEKVINVYGVDAAISTSAMSAPAFVAQTFEEGILHTLRSDRGDFYVMEVTLNIEFTQVTVEHLEEKFDLTILAVNREAHPDAADTIHPGAKLLLLGSLESIHNLKSKFSSWEREEDLSQIKDHTILVSVSGNVGARVLEELVAQKIPTCVITRGTHDYREETLSILGDSVVEVIKGDATQQKVLEQAKIKEARAIIIVNDDDMLNFKIAVLARKLNPKIRTVIRSFDRIFGQKITEISDIDSAISTSAITAPVFVSQSFEKGIIQTLRSKRYKTDFHLIELNLTKKFDPVETEFVEQAHNVTILAVNEEIHPEATDKISQGTKLLFLGDLQSIRKIKSQYCQ